MATDTCFADFNGPVSVSGVNNIPAKDPDQLKAAIALGVTAVTVDADSTVFRNYASGVVTGTECGTKLDHAIAAVGYGTDENGIDYFLVRNSWGEGYGDKGYIKIGRDNSEDEWGVCGILEISNYPTTN